MPEILFRQTSWKSPSMHANKDKNKILNANNRHKQTFLWNSLVYWMPMKESADLISSNDVSVMPNSWGNSTSTWVATIVQPANLHQFPRRVGQTWLNAGSYWPGTNSAEKRKFPQLVLCASLHPFNQQLRPIFFPPAQPRPQKCHQTQKSCILHWDPL